MLIERRLRVAFVSLHTSPADTPGSGDAGGMNVVERHHAKALAALGHEVEILTRRADPDAPEVSELSPGVLLRHITAGPTARIAKSATDQYIGQFQDAMRALPPYDLVYSHHWMSGMAALDVARAWDVPHVQSYHSVAAHPGQPLSDGEPPESPGRVAGEAHLAQHSDLILTISQAEARTVIDRCGADPHRVTVVRPGVDCDLFRPLRGDEPRWSWPGADDTATARGYLLFAARLQPLKGPDLAIEALAHIDPAVRPHLVVAGEASADFASYQSDLADLVTEHGLTDHVTFVGPQRRTDLAAMLRSARVVLVPSHSETFGLVALEAAASGVPVVASASGGLTEAVLDQVTGILMRSRDPQEWGGVLTTILKDPRRTAHLSASARSYALNQRWADVGERLSDIFIDLVEAPYAARRRSAG